LAGRKEYGSEKLARYDCDQWLDEAVSEDVRSLKIKTAKRLAGIVNTFLADRISPLRNTYTWKDVKNYQHSNWYRFQEAIKQHQKEA